FLRFGFGLVWVLVGWCPCTEHAQSDERRPPSPFADSPAPESIIEVAIVLPLSAPFAVRAAGGASIPRSAKTVAGCNRFGLLPRCLSTRSSSPRTAQNAAAHPQFGSARGSARPNDAFYNCGRRACRRGWRKRRKSRSKVAAPSSSRGFQRASRELLATPSENGMIIST